MPIAQPSHCIHLDHEMAWLMRNNLGFAAYTENQCFLLNGIPGCGKSASINFIIAHFSKNEAAEFVLQVDKDSIIYLSRRGKEKLYATCT